MNQDEEHLRLLSLFHYIMAGITAVFSLFPLIHLAIGLLMIFGGDFFKQTGNGNPPPAFIGWFFVFIACFFILIGETVATLIMLNGRFLAKRKHFTFCQVVAIVECIFMPFGTLLGVFTLIVLNRSSVKAMFAPADPSG